MFDSADDLLTVETKPEINISEIRNKLIDDLGLNKTELTNNYHFTEDKYSKIQALYTSGNYVDFIRDAQSYIREEEGNNVELLYQLGLAYKELGDYKTAKTYLVSVEKMISDYKNAKKVIREIDQDK